MPRELSECRVLMVDDEPANLDLLEAFLEEEGFAALLRTQDAREAVRMFAEQSPDIVLLDMHMPHYSGLDVLRDIRQLTAPNDFVPILVLTADSTASMRTRALSDGAHDFLTKPLDAVEVRLRVRNLLRMRLLQLAQQRATRAREQVLSIVAHDLRNPVASIAMDAEMVKHLLSEEHNAVQLRSVQRIERTAQRMHKLIEDLLEVSRLEHGTFAVRAQPVSPHDILAEAEAMLRPIARARGVELWFSGPTELPAINADGERIVQVFSNVIGNALQFTAPGGSVRVTWQTADTDLVFDVADTGSGIAADVLPHVFDPFWQGADARRKGGLGLGLVITRAIVEAHGGRVWLESTPGSGTTVHFTLPFASASAESGRHAVITKELNA